MLNSVQSLSTADLSLVRQTRLLYVDVYPELCQASARAMVYAIECGVDVLANLGDHDIRDTEMDRCLRRGVSIIQKSAPGPSVEHAREMAQAFYDSYSTSLCVLTMGRHGVVYTNHTGTYHLAAHPVQVASTAGAGSTFSAGLLYGRAQSWPDDKTVAFANALAALFCSSTGGTSSSSATEVMQFASDHTCQLTKLR
jgi:sugar/nucleoside kinase (ribokinase family)